jgi:hypothetical protein
VECLCCLVTKICVVDCDSCCAACLLLLLLACTCRQGYDGTCRQQHRPCHPCVQLLLLLLAVASNDERVSAAGRASQASGYGCLQSGPC